MTRSSMAFAGLKLAWRMALIPRLWNAPSRSLPDYLIIGAQKGGTTSLFYLLEQHPQVMRSLCKEVHYFDRNYHRGVSWYRAHFPAERKKRRAKAVTGEASPSYLGHREAPLRVRSLVPDCRLIALLRNPVDRMYSSYHHKVRMGKIPVTFEEWLSRRTPPFWDPHGPDANFYCEALERWLALFPREQCLVLAYEEVFSNTPRTFEGICSHLGIPRWEPDHEERRNTGTYPAMNPSTRADLQELFKPGNERLFSLLGRRFPWD